DPALPPAGVPAVERVCAATQPEATSRFWASADYLLWWQKSPRTAPLIVGVPGANIQNVGGALPAGTVPVFPNGDTLDFGAFSGVRVSAGFYLNRNWGIEASGFVLEEKNKSGGASGDGSLLSSGVALPYTQAGTGTPIALFTNLPGVYAGGSSATASSQVWSGEVNARLDWYRLFCDRCDLIGGFRYIGLRDDLGATSTSTFPNGNVTTISDSFRTRNNYYGAQVGYRSAWYGRKLSADLSMKWGIGVVHQEVTAAGSNTFAPAGGAASTENGGLYARDANLGTFERDKFAFNYELGVNLGYQITPRVRAQVGYTINYLSSVARAGDMVDPVANDARVRFIAPPVAPAPDNRPAFDWSRTTDYWLQGLNFGLSFGY
ncbi:MAG: BBP7 family outer membrane beta-barrel protein, partial [Gemmataceae bacterium]|nr:BBP7 family outer membrane beta-barrel protein [Gemmataceae bacterium]